MKFSELTKELNIKISNDFKVAGIETDSRNIQQNYIFFALKGENYDGSHYIEHAVEMGAKAVFFESHINLANSGKLNSAILFGAEDIKETLYDLVQKFYAPMPENLIAVTGTNGKTSVVNFTSSIISDLGKQAASIGTLGTLISGDYDRKVSYSGLTSPDFISLVKDLHNLKDAGVNHVIMEASSHGLQQGRAGNLKFKSAAFTNFTQDHLDYHKSMDNYFAAKMILFNEYIKEQGYAVLNADIPEFEKITDICNGKKLNIISYGKNAKDIKINNIHPHDNGLDIEIEIFGKAKKVSTKLLGEFQAYNVVTSIGLALSLGFDADKIIAATAKLKSVKGRMDIILLPKQKAKVVIDYAHTPDALEKAISSLKKHTSGKLITLFGCGGDRDATKRPLMGKIAVKNSDIVIVTDDNPRTEDAYNIRKEILAGAAGAQEIAGRKEAIAHGISLLKEGDSLLLAGKGHENYQVIGKERLPFDEYAIVREIIK